MMLITGLSLIRKIYLLWVCKTGEVYILNVRQTFTFAVYIFLNKIF